MISYYEAKADLFAEVGFSEEFMSEWMPFFAASLRKHIEAQYVFQKHCELQKGSIEIAYRQSQISKQCAELLDNPALQRQSDGLMERLLLPRWEVDRDHKWATILVSVLSGGVRKTEHFLTKKLITDSLIVALDLFLRNMIDQGVIRRKRHTYQGAALLYYLGFDDLNPYLRHPEPFPDRMDATSGILNRYRNRRKEALEYLSPDKAKQLMANVANRVYDAVRRAQMMSHPWSIEQSIKER